MKTHVMFWKEIFKIKHQYIFIQNLDIFQHFLFRLRRYNCKMQLESKHIHFLYLNIFMLVYCK